MCQPTHNRGSRRRKREWIKNCILGTSLVVQWLILCLSTQGVWVQSLVRALRSHKLHDTAKSNIQQNKPNKQKSRTRRLHKGMSWNIQRTVNTYPSETIPKNCRRKNTSKLIPQGHNHPDTKTRKRHKKRKLQLTRTKGPHGHRNKNPCQVVSMLNPAIRRCKRHGQFIPKCKGQLSIWNQLM